MLHREINMLTLFVRLADTPEAQGLARTVRSGFRREVWDALVEVNVLDARITAIPDASRPERFEAILLCTTFAMSNVAYQNEFFWRFPETFVALARAAVDSPFALEPLTERQLLALSASTPDRRDVLQPVLETLRAWIDDHDLTLGASVERPRGGEERTQFHCTRPRRRPGSAAESDADVARS